MYLYSPLAIWRNWSSFLSVFDKDLHQFELYYGLSVLALGGYIYIRATRRNMAASHMYHCHISLSSLWSNVQKCQFLFMSLTRNKKVI